MDPSLSPRQCIAIIFNEVMKFIHHCRFAFLFLTLWHPMAQQIAIDALWSISGSEGEKDGEEWRGKIIASGAVPVLVKLIANPGSKVSDKFQLARERVVDL